MILENVIKDAEEMAEIEYCNAQVYDKAKIITCILQIKSLVSKPLKDVESVPPNIDSLRNG